MGADIRRMVAGLVLVAAATAAAAERVLVEAILIRVNDRIVTLSDFSERLMVELSQDRNPPTTTDAMRRYAERIFDALLEEMILLERADEMRVTVEEEAVDQYVASIREENELLDDAAFEQALAQMNMTENDLRARFREQILLNRAARSEVSEPEITTEEVENAFAGEVVLETSAKEDVGVEEAFYALQALCEEEQRPMPSVVFCTGFAPPERIETIVAKSAAHCLLRKPVPSDVLTDTIRVRIGE